MQDHLSGLSRPLSLLFGWQDQNTLFVTTRIQSYREKGSCKCGSFEDNNRRNILGHQPQLKGLFCYLILLLWRLVICTHIHMIYNSHTLESTFKELRSWAINQNQPHMLIYFTKSFENEAKEFNPGKNQPK